MGLLTAAQNLQRFAPAGMALRHSGHSRSAGASSSSLGFMCDISLFSGMTIKKKTTVAIIKNESSAFKKVPYINLLPFIVNDRPVKLG